MFLTLSICVIKLQMAYYYNFRDILNIIEKYEHSNLEFGATTNHALNMELRGAIDYTLRCNSPIPGKQATSDLIYIIRLFPRFRYAKTLFIFFNLFNIKYDMRLENGRCLVHEYESLTQDISRMSFRNSALNYLLDQTYDKCSKVIFEICSKECKTEQQAETHRTFTEYLYEKGRSYLEETVNKINESSTESTTKSTAESPAKSTAESTAESASDTVLKNELNALKLELQKEKQLRQEAQQQTAHVTQILNTFITQTFGL